MKRKAVSGIVLALLFIGMGVLAFEIRPVRSDYVWSETIYIRADGSVEPLGAPVSTGDNVTYTLTDNIVEIVAYYSSAFVIQRDNIVLDGAGYTLQGTDAEESKGIDLSGRTNVTVRNTQIANFRDGIWLYESPNNTISGNSITANFDNGILIYYSSNNSISRNNVANNSGGIYLGYSSDNSISGNNITNSNGNGVSFWSSSYNSVWGNNVTNNGNGIWLGESSNYNSVWGNNVTASIGDSGDLGYGISVIWGSNNNSISENTITANSHGIRLGGYNSVSGNNITNNAERGIFLVGFNSSIDGNNIINNRIGIELNGAYNNTLYHNNFINNTYQTYIYPPGYTNVWDDGYPSGGNYWSDYTGKYPNATEINGSGLWDTPYVIDGYNQDNYPLIPEFPSFLLLPLFMMIILLAVVVYRRKHSSKQMCAPHEVSNF